MTELVQRLRDYRPTNEWGDGVHHVICDEAADEIQRLRAGIKRLSDEEEITDGEAFSLVSLAAKLSSAEAERAEQWRLRRDAEGSRDAMRAAADSLLSDRKALIEAIQPLLGCSYYARENDLSGHEALVVTASEAREAAMVVERINAEEEDDS
jgi:hypothetical protein